MRAIDTRHLGLDKVICCWEVDGVLVDPGPESTLETAAGGAGRRGAARASCSRTSTSTTRARAGRWCAAGPTCRSTCTSAGAPHMASPERLVASAARLYGGEEGLRRLWGEVVPVPGGQHAACSTGGETVLGDFRVEYTPGPRVPPRLVPARADAGPRFVGDVAGVRIPPDGYVVAPTPPPDIDVEAWERSLDLVAGWEPAVARAHPLRPRRRRRAAPRARPRAAARVGRARRPARARRRSRPA